VVIPASLAASSSVLSSKRYLRAVTALAPHLFFARLRTVSISLDTSGLLLKSCRLVSSLAAGLSKIFCSLAIVSHSVRRSLRTVSGIDSLSPTRIGTTSRKRPTCRRAKLEPSGLPKIPFQGVTFSRPEMPEGASTRHPIVFPASATLQKSSPMLTV
jgi:hypothetical protein